MDGISSSSLAFVDDFYFSALIDEKDIFPISDEMYAQELQMQEALISSVVSPMSTRGPQQISLSVNRSSSRKGFKAERKEPGESSCSFCIICMDAKPGGEMFRNTACGHSFCTDCITKHVAAKIQENISNVRCPDINCKSTIEPEACHAILPKEVFDRWDDALCESLLLGAKRFYCPFKDCSAVMVDGELSAHSSTGMRLKPSVVTVSECPNCRRLFCAQCKAPWHAGMVAESFRH